MAKVNFPAKEKANVTRPCLVAVCRGNENIADLLNFLIYMAHEQKVEDSDVTLQLTHSEMLNRPKDEGKRFNFSERSLIGYLDKLDEWKLVTNGKYGRSQVVHTDAINAAIANPPAKPKGKPRGKRKSGNVEANKPATKSSTLAKENVELKLKVEMLQEKVDLLQLKVEMLQEFVEKFQLSKSSESASQAQAEAKNASVYTIDTVYTIDFFTGAYSRVDEEDQLTQAEEKKSDAPASQEGTEQLSYSQGTPTTTPEENENDSHSKFVGGCMAGLIEEMESSLAPREAELIVLRPDAWLQEKPEMPVNATPSQEKPAQTNIFGEALPEKPAAPPTPRPRIPVSVKPDVPEVRSKTANEIQKERKEIERRIWKLLDDAANAKIGRAFTKPMEDLVTGVMDGAYADADFVFSVQDLKARGQSLTFSNIVNNMADAVNKRKAGQQPGKIISFQQGQQQHRGSPNAPLLDEQVIQERSARNLEERKARIAAREAQQAAMA